MTLPLPQPAGRPPRAGFGLCPRRPCPCCAAGLIRRARAARPQLGLGLG